MALGKADDRPVMTIQEAVEEAGRCLLCHDAPCSSSCPGATDPSKFIRQIRFYNFKGAARTVLGNNALGGVCTYVCPTGTTCAGACVREEIDRPIDIDGLQRFAVEYGRRHGIDEAPAPEQLREEKVAVVGAGPGGLSAAAHLVRRGYRVTLFERRGEPGGMLRYGVPTSRLPGSALQADLEPILASDRLELRCDTAIEGDPAKELLGEHAAVFVAPGLWEPRRLELPGIDLPQVTTAIEFLADAQTDAGRCAALVEGQNVAVIGGGSVAMDVARVAREQGAKRIYAVALEDMTQLPAEPDELADALTDGVVIKPQCQLTRVVGEQGKVVAVEGVEIEWIDPEGALVPDNARVVDGTSFRLAVGVVVQAIGQRATAEFKAFVGDGESVLSGGDIVRGAGTVVEAVGDGRRAAEAIDRRLSGGGNGKKVEGAKIELVSSPLPRPGGDKLLEVDFCGVKMPNPFWLSSSPVGNTYEMCARSLEIGWGGVVYKTIGLDDVVKITHPSPRLNAMHRGAQKVVGLQNVEQISDRGTDDNFADLARLKKDFPDRAIVSSIMGLTRASDWVELAKRSEDAGADMIECNFSCPQMTVEGTGHKVGQDAEIIAKLTELTKGACSIPVMAKMTPNVADMVPQALAAKKGGADAISAINTVKAISGVDLELAVPMPNIGGRSSSSGYSGQAVKPIGLRFVSDLAKAPELGLPISGMGGLYTWIDAAEFLLLGATTLQCTTAILQHGYRIVEDLCEGLADYMVDHGYRSVSEMVGKALDNVVDPSELSHATQAISVIDHELCVGCGQCYLTCRDGAAEAIAFDAKGDRRPVVDEQTCFGCLMCKHICPVEGCISYKIVPHHLAAE